MDVDKKPKLTKRERKRIFTMNSATEASIAKGKFIYTSDRKYKGKLPTYAPNPSGLGFIKIGRGIPFVRVS